MKSALLTRLTALEATQRATDFARVEFNDGRILFLDIPALSRMFFNDGFQDVISVKWPEDKRHTIVMDLFEQLPEERKLF